MGKKYVSPGIPDVDVLVVDTHGTIYTCDGFGSWHSLDGDYGYDDFFQLLAERGELEELDPKILSKRRPTEAIDYLKEFVSSSPSERLRDNIQAVIDYFEEK